MYAIDHLLADDLIKALFYGTAGSPTCMIFQGKTTNFSDGLYTLQLTRAMKHMYTSMPQITEKAGKIMNKSHKQVSLQNTTDFVSFSRMQTDTLT